MRIPSGKTDQYLYFVAKHETTGDRMAGLTGFTVLRSRNGSIGAMYDTPTIVEIDSDDAPGDYALLVDEDTTIAPTSDSEEYMVHIQASEMEPVTRTVELYRRPVTTGRTLAVDADGSASGLAGQTAQLTNIQGRLPAALTGDGFMPTDTKAVAGLQITGGGVTVDRWRPVT